MGDVNYAPLIGDMTWSYSRVKSFEDCPYRWYLKYIRRLPGKEMFFASYGSFMHKLIERYHTENKTTAQLVDLYLQDFKSCVKGAVPNEKVFCGYFMDGLKYLREIQPLPYQTVAVEKKVEFKLNGNTIVGYLDFFGDVNGEYVVLDNKSRNLKQRTGRSKPTKSDMELDSYLRQLYIYSAAVEQEFGKLPKHLCFNCFRSQTLIEEPFQEDAYKEAKEWFTSTVSKISMESDFRPSVEFFKCRYLCEMQEHCEYYELSQRR